LKNDFENAILQYSHALKKNENDIIIITKRCYCYWELKKWQEMLYDAQYCMQLKSDDKEGYFI
jgi:hypothetical protein